MTALLDDLAAAAAWGRTAGLDDPAVAHRSLTPAHLGNIAMQLGRKLRWDPKAERFLNDDQANRMLSRACRAPWKA